MPSCEWWHDAEQREAFLAVGHELGYIVTEVSSTMAPLGGMSFYPGSLEDAIRELRALDEWWRCGGSKPTLMCNPNYV
jgi:hypothetical protein